MRLLTVLEQFDRFITKKNSNLLMYMLTGFEEI
jgi:hypothetical protein